MRRGRRRAAAPLPTSGADSTRYNLAQADTNGNNITLLFTAPNDFAVEKTIVTTAADPTDAIHFGLSALPNTPVATNGSLITSGTGPAQLTVASGLASGDVKAINGLSAGPVTTIKPVFGLTIADTIATVTGNINGSVIGTVASVVDLSATPLAESAAVPAASATPLQKLNFIATIARNKITQSTTTQVLRSDGDAATIGTSIVSDTGAVFTRGQFS